MRGIFDISMITDLRNKHHKDLVVSLPSDKAGENTVINVKIFILNQLTHMVSHMLASFSLEDFKSTFRLNRENIDCN